MLCKIILIIWQLLSLSHVNLSETINRKLKVFVGMDLGTKSHIKYLLEISNILKNKGHSITYVAPKESMKFGDSYNFTKIELKGQAITKNVRKRNFLKMNEEKYDFSISLNQLARIIGMSYTNRVNQMSSLLDTYKPDVILCDSFFLPCIDVARIKNIPIISGQCSTDIPLLSPSSFMTPTPEMIPTTTENMSIFEKIDTVLIKPLKLAFKSRQSIIDIDNARINANVRPSNEFFYTKNVFTIANTFIGFDVPRPVDQSIAFVGPIVDDKFEALSSEFEEFFKLHRKIIYIGFGSINILPKPHIINLLYGIIKGYNENLYDGIIWGLGSNNIEDFPINITIDKKVFRLQEIINNKHKDIKIVPWAPQISILKNKNTVLSISHAGIESIFEAMLNEVPILAMPYFGDQPKNAYKIKEFGNGDCLDPKSTSGAEIFSKIKKILLDDADMIKINVERMGILANYNSKRKTYAANIIEQYAMYAISCRKLDNKDGLPCELRDLLPASTRMSYFKAKNLDVYLIITAISLGFIYVIYCGISNILNQKKLKTN